MQQQRSEIDSYAYQVPTLLLWMQLYQNPFCFYETDSCECAQNVVIVYPLTSFASVVMIIACLTWFSYKSHKTDYERSSRIAKIILQQRVESAKHRYCHLLLQSTVYQILVLWKAKHK